MSILQDILKFSIGTISLSGAIVYLAKSIFNKVLDKDLEKFKIEQQRIADEYKFKFSKLHEERAVVIRELYSKLLEVEDCLSSAIKSIEKKQYDLKIYKEMTFYISQYMDYSNKNKLFFNKDIEYYLKELDAIIILILNLFPNDKCENKIEIEDYEKALELMNRMLKEALPEFKEKLETSFREILGVI